MATQKTLIRIVSSFILTAAISQSASASDVYRLHEHRAAGQTLTYVFNQHTRDKSTLINNGVPGVTDTTTAQYWKVTETILAAADGSATQARVDFDPASVDTSQDAGQAEKRIPPPYAGKPVTLSFKPDGSIASDFQGDVGVDDDLLLEGILSADQDNFPDKPVAVGDAWDNSAKLSKKIAGFNPKDHYSVTYRLDSVNTVGGKQIARISYTNIFSYHTDGDKMTGAIETDTVDKTIGTMLVDIAAGLIVENDNKESTKVASPPTWPDKLDDVKEQTYHGEIAGDSTVWPPVVPVAATPPPAPAPAPPAVLNQLPAGRIALRVLSPELQPLHIDEIDGIYLIRPNSSYKLGPTTSPPTPMVLGRLTDGSVALDSQMFEQARTIPNFRNVQRMVAVFRCNDAPMRVAGPFPADPTQPITLNALADPQDCSFDPDHGPRAATPDEIAARVVDAQGHAVVGAVASFPTYQPRPSPGLFGGLFAGATDATTGADGVFRFAAANQNGRYLQITKDGFSPRWIINPPAGKGFTVCMDNRTRLRGTLKLPDGSPASDAVIELGFNKILGPDENLFAPIPWSARTDAQGAYDIPLEPGDYDVRVTSPAGLVERVGRLSLSSRESTALPSRLNAGVALKLEVINSLTAQPAAGVKFAVHEVKPGFEYDRPGTERTTDAGGIAQWEHLFPGPMLMRVESETYARWWPRSDGPVPRPQGRFNATGIGPLQLILAGPAQTVQIIVEPAIHVTGQVLSPQGLPVKLAEVNVDGIHPNLPGMPPSRDGPYYQTITDEQGNFSIAFPDTQRDAGPAKFDPPGYAIVANDIMHKWGEGTTPRFTAKPGESKSFNIKLLEK